MEPPDQEVETDLLAKARKIGRRYRLWTDRLVV
jgi:hypothetical protein